MILCVMVLTLGNTSVPTVEAGASTIVIEETSYAEGIKDSIWSNPDANVSAKDKVLIFPESSTSETRLITKTAVRVSEMNDELVHAKMSICLEKLPNGEKFILAFGLSSIEAMSGETGNVEIEFMNQGGLKARVVAYGEDGEKEVVPITSFGQMGRDITIEISITKAGELTLIKAGKVVAKGTIPVSGEGRVGFLQTGNCAAKVKNVDIRSYRYDAPENCDINEDFESGSINVNLLTSKMLSYATEYLPAYAKVMDYEGSKVFMLHNAGETYLGTTHKYSNFEFSFDLPYLQTVTEWNAEGEDITPSSSEFIIGWGFPEMDPPSAADYMLAEQSVTFRADSMVVPDGYEDLAVVPENYPFFKQGNERGVSIKLSVIDAQVIVSMKWIEETKWTEILKYNTGTQTSLGYVQLWALTPGNLAIDNLKIVNKDANPNLLTVDTERFYLNKAEDYEYTEAENVYKDLSAEEETFNWYVLIPATAGGCIVVLISILGVVTIKRHRKGGGSNAE